MRKYFWFLGLITLFLVHQSCNSEERKKNVPDVSQIRVQLTIHRFDLDVAALDTNRIAEGLAALTQKYPQFTQFYFHSGAIWQWRTPQDSVGAAFPRFLLTLPPIRQIVDTTAVAFKSFAPQEKELIRAFQFFKYYFPKRPIPEIYTFVSWHNFAAILPPMDNAVGIGVDTYLGADYAGYEGLGLPRYLMRTYTLPHLPSRTMEVLLTDLAGNPSGPRLLDLMIHNGKILYALDHLLPNTPDSIKLGYTAAQTAFCKEKELEMWTFFGEQKLLYETQQAKIQTYISPAPTSRNMPPDAPGRTGNYIGWRIVEQFMQKNPNLTLDELFALRDAQQILDVSKYKPMR
jgi:hypothetical protein